MQSNRTWCFFCLSASISTFSAVFLFLFSSFFLVRILNCVRQERFVAPIWGWKQVLSCFTCSGSRCFGTGHKHIQWVCTHISVSIFRIYFLSVNQHIVWLRSWNRRLDLSVKRHLWLSWTWGGWSIRSPHLKLLVEWTSCCLKLNCCYKHLRNLGFWWFWWGFLLVCWVFYLGMGFFGFFFVLKSKVVALCPIVH